MMRDITHYHSHLSLSRYVKIYYMDGDIGDRDGWMDGLCSFYLCLRSDSDKLDCRTSDRKVVISV